MAEMTVRSGLRPATLEEIEGISVNLRTKHLQVGDDPGPEVTPEMIAAGRECIAAVWLDFTGPNGHGLWGPVLTRVFREMSAVREATELLPAQIAAGAEALAAHYMDLVDCVPGAAERVTRLICEAALKHR